jgi:hypothetical protein
MSEGQKIEFNDDSRDVSAKKPKSSGRRKKLFEQIIFDIVRLAVLALIVGLVFLVFHYFKTHKPNPIPGSIKKSASFTLYYPTQVPQGYSFDKSSANVKNGIVFLSWKNASSKRIQITEQARPAKSPDLNTLTKPPKVETSIPGVAPPSLNPLFQKAYSPVGQAIVGSNTSGSPTAIVLTDKTLINVSGPSDLPNNALNNIVQTLKS